MFVMFWRKYDQLKSRHLWERYRTQRNKVTKLRKQCKNQYLKEQCIMESNGKDFWKTIKPLVSSKSTGNLSDIALMEDNLIINENIQVANIMNNYFKDITKDIGDQDELGNYDSIRELCGAYEKNTSVKLIRDELSADIEFNFSKVSTSDIYKKLKGLNPKKATGFDKIPPKLIQLGAKQLSLPITNLVKLSITTAHFPSALKQAEVTPIFKKGDLLDKMNYRPVSALPCLSKVFEGIIIDQLNEFLNPIFSPYLSGFRKGHSCQTVLLRMVEQCKKALDHNTFSGALLTDLSKAFDCLPHRLLISKLRSYGVGEVSCSLIASYFRNRRQRVKIRHNKTDWAKKPQRRTTRFSFWPFCI